MSFQDVGKPGSGPKRAPRHQAQLPTIRDSSGGDIAYMQQEGTNGNNQNSVSGYAQVSDGILQYQRNVGLLEKMTKKIGSREDGAVFDTQYKLQVDVINQLGQKIERQLRTQENAMVSMSRSEATRSRATHMKLTKDFRRVEATFKNLQLEVRRKKAVADAAQREREEEEHRRLQEEGGAGQTESERRMQMQLQQDRLNEEIMREREAEIRNINQGMHQVNEIYKDLAHIVGEQQEQIDTIETQMDDANATADRGLKQIEKANDKSSESACVIS
mmetsp:Transcript_8061/g.11097  ORF Transcript_8061/g.11097 Transcript_8061/m.11097 type:complete len:274 (-) Transcript_8061:425-1246(-)|eukprot:CAMPEP_0185728826 /NCGR_PEP_ID=MMETSP1171-20130828/4231_1 /TAXON_ID=374046 /ORGANISM="Helicotheca tamensis, Strain CCMP826" /LENGTH=273 /DNA_ID=CAMNT_0028397573 /DNA_START=85 /DNA_END=906 /DNA_ORIENTATION=-